MLMHDVHDYHDYELILAGEQEAREQHTQRVL